jgi:hypothetical protein
MITLKVNEKEYKVKFGFNSLCDTDLLDRTQELINIFNNEKAETDEDVKGIGKIKDLFSCVRELLFVGFERYNPVNSIQEIGNILDDYYDEGKSIGEDRGIINLFVILTSELASEGFLAGLLNQMTDGVEEKNNISKIPQDHKKPLK